ncbi:TPA: adenylate kinase [candidate division CPR2 bacterium]|uniref:Adenylate kinase n=1 Tax=candidate division CPR2 bacterium GW2011_GWC1_41_48 TaxID=1618344 RepID=A0A0G0W9I3_UNCC2|nr:MAG: Adenylate kinase [candidate division CPR2 bacterium GW2011_GWC2_39_35]KKR29499.1 MAG: Adenylate kinase [candidate division CPR2 bacterium GW2011_GWD2_39_7]KKR29724.1 MAG: Adenylate kinase [candidate division CPR2 bacterium GW2011_GWD1_39_7]KKS09654.1 MAG: Adenylate kinase [candidate division CPR2 bacterium GW2011_GWC1_41_48]OGB59508.1 MAG: hypothetical protein A2Y27_00955 [candidate division CPR2 bacterium GWD1_39_7]OGB71726.1 MAG: hypothetical protein A2Y26_03830 [candidate division C
MNPNPNLIIFGPPGAGKDTQVEVLLKKLDIVPIETGAIIRDMVKSDSKIAEEIKNTIARGDLVNDSLMEAIIKDKLDEVPTERGTIFDGFPRTIKQAETLHVLLSFVGRKIDKVLFLDVPEEVLIERLTQRKICGSCGKTAFPHEERCSQCGGELVKRIDDNIESIKARIVNYRAKTAPIIAFYEKRGLIFKINGNQKPQDVTSELLTGLGID